MNDIHSWITLFGISTLELRAIAAGLLVSFLGTQALKFYLPPVMKRSYKMSVRTVATILGFIPAFVLTHEGILSVIAGLAAPAAYKLGVTALYHYWPWLEQKMSAQPIQLKAGPDGTVGVKVGDDVTQYMKFPTDKAPAQPGSENETPK